MRHRVVAVLVLLLLAVPVTGAVAQTSLRAQQWGLDMIRAPEVWSTTRGGGTVVAVVDTGVDLRHPDLAPRLLRNGSGDIVGRDFVDGGSPQDENGHGTLVAGIVAAAARNADSVAGVAPRTRIMPVRALDARGAGRASDIDAAIRWAVDNGADVVNLSLESAVPAPGQVIATGFDGAVRYAWDRGVVVVAASGNSGTPFTDYSASTPVLLVGATTRDDRRATFSDGSRRDMVVAPGVDIVTTACDPCGAQSQPGYAEATGTSFAAPHVAGAIALLLADGRSPQQAVTALRETAVPVSGSGLGSSGHGRIDVAAAMGLSAPSAAPERSSTGEPGTSQDDPAPAADRTDDSSDRPAPSPSPDPAARPTEPDEPPAAPPTPPDEEPATDDGSPDPDELPDRVDDTTIDTGPDGADRDAVAAPGEGDVSLSGSGTGLRFGLLEGLAAVLVGVSAMVVTTTARRWDPVEPGVQ